MLDLTYLDEKLALMNTLPPLPLIEVKILNHDKKIEHIWSSNAIEGSTLNKYETAVLLETGLTVHEKPIKDYLAALDLSQAYDYVQNIALEKEPISTMMIRDINRLVNYSSPNEEIKRNAGIYRVVDVHPNKVLDVHYAPAFDIANQINDLVAWFNDNDQKYSPVYMAAALHQKFVTIHPFLDGNGRTARLLMNFELTRHGFPIINIQPDKKSRDEYMETLRYTQVDYGKNGLDKFVELVAQYVDQELDRRITLLKQHEQEVENANKDTNL